MHEHCEPVVRTAEGGFSSQLSSCQTCTACMLSTMHIDPDDTGLPGHEGFRFPLPSSLPPPSLFYLIPSLLLCSSPPRSVSTSYPVAPDDAVSNSLQVEGRMTNS